jgi:hypothetical protein
VSKRIGTPFESALVRYAKENGFPWADRIPLSGALDRGDVALCPGLIVECKAGKAAENASDEQIKKWLVETERERVNANAAIGLLVTKRRGIGAVRMGEQWCHLDGGVFADLIYDRHDGEQYEQIGLPIRTHLANVVELLRDAGYGTPHD